jgi:formyl-CoA transferase/CoA:oxalate CoA-transferase
MPDTDTDTATSVRPLVGVRVLDLTRHMSGPYAALFLSDYGADIVKVESINGDQARGLGKTFIGDDAAVFYVWNRGKRSLCLDYAAPESAEVLRRLIESADVVMHNYRPGVADRFGFGYDKVRAINPKAVYASVSGFGRKGPWSGRPATDPVIQSMGGVTSVTGERGGEPLLAGVPIADFGSAMQLVIGILMALRARDLTGEGQEVHVPMVSTVISTLTTRLAGYWFGNEVPVRMGSAHSLVMPYQIWPTKDGFAVAGTWGEDSWGRFCAAIERPDLFDDPRFATNTDRVQNRDVLEPILREVFLERTTDEWNDAFADSDGLFGPVHDLAQIFEHPQVRELNLIGEMDHPAAGRIPTLNPVIEMSQTPGRVTLPPPLLGQHSAEILAEVGFSEAEVQALVDAGTVRVANGTGRARENSDGRG